MKEALIVVDVFSDIAKAMNTEFRKKNQLNLSVMYVFGRQFQIIKKLLDLSESKDSKDTKYPLLALYQEFPEKRGSAYYSEAVIPKVIIATLSNESDDPPLRYQKNFKPILYPIYYEFLNQVAKHPNTVISDADAIQHTKCDRMGNLPIGSDLADYIDAIEINGLNLIFSQIKKC